MIKRTYLISLFFVVALTQLYSQNNYREYLKEYRLRADSVIEYYKNLPFAVDAFRAMVKLNKGYDVETALKIIDSITYRPRGDMFWFYPVMSMYLYGEKNIPPNYKKKIRESLKNYTPYRGDTENHWMMYYVSLYLAAQTWSNEEGSTWFNGKNSKENFEDAEGWLNFWMQTTTTIGQGEFDSPIYAAWFITPLFMLYQFSKDPVMKTKAEIMLNWVLTDFFVEYLDGIYCGAHSRIYQYDILTKRKTLLSLTGTFFLGDRPIFHKDGTPWNLTYNSPIYAMSGYKLPEIIYNIATDRSIPYIHKERKRSRNRIRYYEEKNPIVTKYNYMTKNYSLGGIQYGWTEEILQHTWSLNWKSVRENEITTFFTIHPYFSDFDMASLFTTLRKTVVPDVVGSKTTYDKEDKWVGSSPYEKLFQYKNTMIGLYDFSSKDVIYKHYNGFFSKDLLERIEDPSGWIFCRSPYVYFAFYPLQPYEWIEEQNGWKLRSVNEKNGFILEVKMPEEFKSFNDFQKNIKSNFIDKIELGQLKVTYKNLDGDELEFDYSGTRKINGKIDDPRNYKLFDSPFVQSDVGSNKMEINYKNKKLILDLKNIKIEER
jgi:hypothetical protein